jgi:hypothetical protein
MGIDTMVTAEEMDELEREFWGNISALDQEFRVSTDPPADNSGFVRTFATVRTLLGLPPFKL